MEKKKMQLWKIILIASIVVTVLFVGLYFFLKYQTYNSMQIIYTYENKSTDNAEYKACMDGVLRYSKDGVALLTEEGEEIWNQPCQMSHPIVEVCGDSVVVGDEGGTSIFVFQKKGLKGEMQTTRPIEKLAVSSQGIVAAILKDEETPKVMCYDAKGNILIEHNISPRNTGYPMDVALSEDGKALLVSYLCVNGAEMVSKATYYYFGEEAETQKNYQVLQTELTGAVAPVTAFLDKNTSLVVTDSGLLLFEGLKEPKKFASVEWKEEIQGVAYNQHIIAVVVKKESSSGYKLHIYNKKGEELSAVDVDREYSNIKAIDEQVILFDAKMCSIYSKNGIHKYEGKMDESIFEVFPISGLNKYMVINAGGFQKVRLAR